MLSLVRFSYNRFAQKNPVSLCLVNVFTRLLAYFSLGLRRRNRTRGTSQTSLSDLCLDYLRVRYVVE